MNKITKLSKEHAIKWYGVPEELANDDRNTFWGDTILEDGTPITYDMPRSLIAVIPINDYETQLYIRQIDTELFDFMEGDYNSFDSPHGKSITLDAERFKELIEIFRHHASTMSASSATDNVLEVDSDYLIKRNFQPSTYDGFQLRSYANYKNLFCLIANEKTNNLEYDTLIVVESLNKFSIIIYNLPHQLDTLIGEYETDRLETNTVKLNQHILLKLVDWFERIIQESSF